jgi:hypothetical protein
VSHVSSSYLPSFLPFFFLPVLLPFSFLLSFLSFFRTLFLTVFNDLFTYLFVFLHSSIPSFHILSSSLISHSFFFPLSSLLILYFSLSFTFYFSLLSLGLYWYPRCARKSPWETQIYPLLYGKFSRILQRIHIVIALVLPLSCLILSCLILFDPSPSFIIIFYLNHSYQISSYHIISYLHHILSFLSLS